MRNLTKTLAILSLLAPSSGYSLGIGDIKLHSALNQNLDAEISLVISAGENVSEIKVSLAPPDKFDEAGVPWSSFLSKLKFTTFSTKNGSVIIKLSSREAIKEPFLDFLIEVNWSKGSLYREFTLLIDPPAVYNQATLPILTPSESYEAENTKFTERQTKQREQISTESYLSEETQYGPTRRNDSLWIIAERASRSEGVSVEQMMIALYENNPHAFYKENVHALSTGKTLKIPERDVVLKLSKKQALAEYNKQTNVWKNRISSSPVEVSSSKGVKLDNQLTLVAPTEADVTNKVVLTPENEQVSAQQKESTHDDVSKAIDKSLVSTSPLENDGLQDKVVALEKQLAMMQQILALKDQQLANLQNQSQSKPVLQPELVQTTTQGQTGAAKLIAQQKAVHSEVKPIKRSEPELETAINTNYLWVGGICAGTLPIFGWLWWRKRKFEVEFNNQIPINPSRKNNISETKIYNSETKEKFSTNNQEDGGKSAFLNELMYGDLNTFDTDQGEIDPISEADVYLAYGRYQQAEELLREVLRTQPSRDDCKFKLLEIFYLNNNDHAFEAYAAEIAKSGKKDDAEFWSKVSKMGKEICRDSKLFSSETEDFSLKENLTQEKNNVNLTEIYGIDQNKLSNFNRNTFGLSSFVKSFDNENPTEIPQINKNENIDFYLSKKSISIEYLNENQESYVNETPDDKVIDEFESYKFDYNENENAIEEINEIDIFTDKKSVNNVDLINDIQDKLSELNDCLSNDSFSKHINLDRPIIHKNSEYFDQKDVNEVFELADNDKLETKFDMAKEFFDLSDANITLNMACEVFEKDSAEQKNISKTILDGLSKKISS